MVDWSGKKERARIASLPDPRRGQEWFENLSPQMRNELTDHWRGEQERMLELTLRSRHGVLREVLQCGVLFTFFDLLAIYGSASSHAAQFAAGAVTGLVWVAIDATRLSAAVTAMAAYGIVEFLTHGLVLPNFLLMIGVGGVASWLGGRREEGPYH